MDEVGGAVAAIEQGFVQREIEDAAFRYQREVEQGERVIVGVNRYQEHEQEPIELHRLDPEAERRQLERTERVRAERDAEAAGRALEESGASRARTRTCCFRCGRRCGCGARWARSARSCARSSGRTTPSGRSADPPRLADVPGAEDPDLGVFVRLSRRSSRRGHELERAVLDSRSGGKARYLRLGRDAVSAARSFRPDVVYAHFLVPTGLLAALASRAPLVVTAHGRDVRNIGAFPGIRAATRYVVRRAAAVVAVSDYLRHELETKVPEARGKVEVVDCGVDLGGSACSTRRPDRVPLRRVADRAQECGAPGGRLRAARLGHADVRRRRAATRRRRDSPRRDRHRARRSRRDPESGRARTRRLPAEPDRAVRARLEAWRPVGRRTRSAPPEFVRGGRRARRPDRRGGHRRGMRAAAALPGRTPAARAAAEEHDLSGRWIGWRRFSCEPLEIGQAALDAARPSPRGRLRARARGPARSSRAPSRERRPASAGCRR